MKLLFTIILAMGFVAGKCQSLGKVPDTVRTQIKADQRGIVDPDAPVVVAELTDEEIKARLLKLAMENPAIMIADANINIAQANKAKSKSNFLAFINAGANVNEFVINGSAAASFFPKYNLGVTIPFDIVAKQKQARRTADEMLAISEATKLQQVTAIKTELFIRYEDYKEKKQLVELQKISMDSDYSAYESAQQEFADGSITLIEMNRAYQSYTIEKSKLVSRERDLQVAILNLEEIIGVPLKNAIPSS